MPVAPTSHDVDRAYLPVSLHIHPECLALLSSEKRPTRPSLQNCTWTPSLLATTVVDPVAIGLYRLPVLSHGKKR